MRIACLLGLVFVLVAGTANAWEPYTSQGGPATISATPAPNPGTDKQGNVLLWGRPFYRFYNNNAIGTTHYVYFAADQATDRNVVANGAHVQCYSGSGWLRWIPYPNVADSVEVTIDSDITKKQAEYWYSGKLFAVRMGDASGTTGVTLEIW